MATTVRWTLLIFEAFLIGTGRYCSEGRAAPFLRGDDLKQYIKNPEEILEHDVFEAHVDYRGRYRRSAIHKYASQVTFTAFGEDYHLDLVLADQFFSPDLKVEYVNEDGSITEKPLEVKDCFYHGYAISHNASDVAMSLCYGKMHGLISTKFDNIYITPLTKEHSDDYARRHKRNADGMHLIYKRNVDDVPFCDNKTYVPGEEEEDDTPPTRLAQVNSANLDDSYIPPKYLEVCLMLDIDFQDNYPLNNVEVAMAIMNVVSRRFTEPSAEVILRIYIVRMLLLPNDNPTIDNDNFNIDANLNFNGDTLDSVSQWGRAVNPPIDGIPQRWDNIHILSGKDLADASNPNVDSSLLGLAFSAGTCTLGLGVAIVEDVGIATGLVSAHEIGHTLTLGHDQDLGCSAGFVMSAVSESGGNAFRWSTCSQMELKQFLRWQRPDSPSACLENVPTAANVNALPTLVLPGSDYTFDEQCRQTGGTESCSTTTCASLICSVGGSCVPQNAPAAEGTSCGVGSEICLAGNCVSSTLVPAPVTGGWSAWLDSTCSRTCGGGVIIRQRVCNNPFPSWGGAPCVGEGVEFRLCNLQPCSNSADDFRNEQCAATASEPFQGMISNWMQFFFPGADRFPEDLHCRNPCAQVGGALFTDRPPGYNIDGTECWDFNPSGASDLYRCVGGICEVFGCNGDHQGNVKYDVCRICGGDGSTCSLVTGSATVGTIEAFNEIHIIPVGSTSIVITNNDYGTTSHVAITGTTTGLTYFRGSGFLADPDLRIYNGDFLITHEFSANRMMETFRSNGPTPDSLRIEVFWSTSSTETVEYQYYVQDTFFWSIGSLSTCSVTCGEGVQTRSVVCRSTTTQQIATDSICITNVGPKPVTTISCNINTCPIWVTGIFGQCNAVCGDGIQTRSVTCQLNGLTVPDSQCDLANRPTAEMPCNVGSCDWVVGNYGTCSVTCGSGVQTRSVTCTNINNNQVVPETNCEQLARPTTTRTCSFVDDCPLWVTGPYGDLNTVPVNDVQCDSTSRPETQRLCNAGSCDWVVGNYGTCSVTCGPGTQTRSVTCTNLDSSQSVPESNCDPLSRPLHTRTCSLQDNCAVWVTGTFGPCNGVCGDGIQTRSVTCQLGGFTVPDVQCDVINRPTSQMTCNVGSCDWVVGIYGPCSVTCGTGTQTRSVTCTNSNNNQVVPETNCDPLSRPLDTRTCSLQDNCAVWVTGTFGPCNGVCGDGIQTRSVTCQLGGFTVPDVQCDVINRPTSQMTCNVGSCDWVVGIYGPCSVTCGTGTQTRSVTCTNSNNNQVVPETNCDPLSRPLDTRTCSLQDNCAVWVTGTFGLCNAVCGDGIQTRSVTCQLGGFTVPDVQCDVINRPTSQMTCNVGSCDWVVGIYGPCSVTCGTGTQTRSVTCTNSNNNQVVPETNCSPLSRPLDTRTCSLQDNCAVWVTGTFGLCNAVCGDGIQTRSVTCQLGGFTVPDVQCDLTNRPTSQMTCNVGSCDWVVGTFSPCSVTCGTGTQTRFVTCRNLNNNQVVPETNCNPFSRPLADRPCSFEDNCAVWVTGPYGGCNAVCGDGIQTRSVTCQLGGFTVPDVQCDLTNRPTSQMTCNVGSCDWVVGTFSPCSVTCGTGTQTRFVTCRNLNNNQVVPETNCNPFSRPLADRPCSFEDNCAVWVTGPYGGCNAVCGDGIQTRSVTCQLGGFTVPDVQCDLTNRPTSQMTCNVGSCDWVVGTFSPCSVTCGTGTQTRFVTCRNLNNNQVVPETNCNPFSRPLADRPCSFEDNCAVWVTGPYGGCNPVCGAGSQTREVTCRINDETVDDARCDPSIKPETQRPCNAGFCRWFARPRSTCSVTCGFGTITRTVDCVNDLGIIVPDSNCNSQLRPPSIETCREIVCSDKPIWVSSAFGECSASFGAGKKVRTVRCQLGLLVVDDALCNTLPKPNEEQKCISLRCLIDRNCEMEAVFGNPFLERAKK